MRGAPPGEGRGRRAGPRRLRGLALVHKAFAAQNNISYPLLADFHPKGAVAEKYGVYLPEKGISARTAFVIGKDGKIRDVVASEIPVGRNIGELLEKAR